MKRKKKRPLAPVVIAALITLALAVGFAAQFVPAASSSPQAEPPKRVNSALPMGPHSRATAPTTTVAVYPQTNPVESTAVRQQQLVNVTSAPTTYAPLFVPLPPAPVTTMPSPPPPPISTGPSDAEIAAQKQLAAEAEQAARRAGDRKVERELADAAMARRCNSETARAAADTQRFIDEQHNSQPHTGAYFTVTIECANFLNLHPELRN